MIRRETAEHNGWGHACDGWHLVRRPELRIILERMPAHTAEARHNHRTVGQFFVIPSGRARFELGDAVFSRHAVDGVEVPSGALRRIRNEEADDLEFLVVSLPHSHRDRLTLEEHV